MKGRSIALAGVLLIVIAIASVAIWHFIAPRTTSPQTTKEASINGAGATFPFPLYDRWISEYCKARPNVKINYQPIGSGGGIRAHMEKTVHFAASDAPLSEEQFQTAPGTLHVPMTIGGVVVVYNLPDAPRGLNFTGEVLAKIFLGEVKRWSDPAIVALNPGARLPDEEIVVVHRSDSSGTTYVFTDYLSTVSREWEERVGRGVAVKWPAPRAIGAKGNDGVAATVQQTPYSIGYVELAYAMKTGMPYGRLMNAAGEYVEPSIESVKKAVEYAAVELPRGNESWSNVSIVRSLARSTQARGAYPIVSFSYIMVYKELSTLPGMDEATARALVDFLWWCVHEGQNYAAELYYVPLPSRVVRLNEDTLKMITFNGQKVLRS
jgi:phosphate transport system permease protein/phosphate transport system substrate-binding protein